MEARPDSAQNLSKRGQKEVDVPHRGAVPHQANPPGFAGHHSEARADFYPVILQQAPPDLGIIRAAGNVDAVESEQALFRHIADAHGVEARAKAAVRFTMPGEADLESFLADDRESFVQSVSHVDRRG